MTRCFSKSKGVLDYGPRPVSALGNHIMPHCASNQPWANALCCVCPTAQAVTTAQLTSSNSLSLCNSVTAIIFPALTEPNIFPLKSTKLILKKKIVYHCLSLINLQLFVIYPGQQPVLPKAVSTCTAQSCTYLRKTGGLGKCKPLSRTDMRSNYLDYGCSTSNYPSAEATSPLCTCLQLAQLLLWACTMWLPK